MYTDLHGLYGTEILEGQEQSLNFFGRRIRPTVYIGYQHGQFRGNPRKENKPTIHEQMKQRNPPFNTRTIIFKE